MKKTYLRWIVPILIYSVFVMSILNVHYQTARRDAFYDALAEQNVNIGKALYESDVQIKEVEDICAAIARDCANIDFNNDTTKINEWLAYLMDRTYVESVVLCDEQGYGYSESGKMTSIIGESFFNDVSSSYYNGGRGLLYLGKYDNYDVYEMASVTSLTFMSGQKGYLIAFIDTEDLPDQIFDETFNCDEAYLVSMEGDVIIGSDKQEPAGQKKLWEIVKKDVSMDSINKAITNKIEYRAQLKGYGYVSVIPSLVTAGGVVAFISDETLDSIVEKRMDHEKKLMITAGISLLVLCILFILCNICADRLEIIIKQKKKDDQNVDS